MKVAVYSKTGEKVKELALPKIFDVKFQPKNITRYFNYLRAAQRSPIANTKNRGEVSGGGRKPWRQKGTGNARVGSTRSPLWVGGGVTFGPTNERNFHQRINRKEKRQAILSLITEIAKNKKVIISDLEMAEPKTRKAVEILTKLNLSGKIAIIIPENKENTWLAMRNIAGVKVMSPNMIDFIYLLAADNVVMTEDAFLEFEKVFGEKKER
jgi:large subunit ribosomal protein L4